jgi:Cu+-exporting ATPase
MLSGDRAAVADHIGNRLGFDEVHAQLNPEEKLSWLAAHTESAFVGDGINDAPALTQATVGLAIGSGTQVAIESADIVLMKSDPLAVVDAIRVAEATLRNIRQNLVWAFGYNLVLIPVAMGAWGFSLSPMLAAGAMALSSVFVVGNALRLRWQ